MRTVLVTVGIAVLGLAFMPSAARAAQSSQEISEGTAYQVALCEAGGGTATVDVKRTVEGVVSTTVKCTGGLLDGVNCDNMNIGTFCSFAAPPDPGSQTWQRVDFINDLETGSDKQIKQVVADVEAGNNQGSGTRASLVSPDDQQQDQDTHDSKHKKGKHGKKGGKGRKK
jgi:hypothetical protein